ncbi:hypothetical protein V1264_021398 [Littorina saxatilis]|uniref:Secreted protein n=1 Tax=Littorina saxatilis TaxID=31220 RepID=A0AAN9AIA5_9CAEN
MKFHKIRTLVCVSCFVLVLRVVYVSLTAQDAAQIVPPRPRYHSIFRSIFKNKSAISSLVSKPPGNSDSGSTRKVLIVDNGTSMTVARAIYRRHGVVLFTMVNDTYFPFTASWCCNTAPMTNIHHRALFLTTDRTTGQRLTKLWPDVTVVTLNSSRFSGS